MSNIEKLRTKYSLSIESPFTTLINGEAFEFDALISGYGAKNGMLISTNGHFMNANRDEILTNGYGYSCFNIHGRGVTENFDETLEDWGKV
ncbi:hypothetical protein MKZ42_04505 [Pseudoalteromonas shioyasakiensis]|uniref:Uncharacterized protein n=1 Tax=Pseudoalteromonas shioyasakiensis TaxID=1190813 RepID=A0ABT6TWH0_9GAMM|nr:MULTISPECIES: hypothetical protein [Pseudoalteromonas]MDI4668250.1 hypothetical protein [Pseudoalteromonas shioyasakiensis]MDI4672520.1 hypothetical protein [Pseudoalteromonas shioyasakiensis]MDI4684584.1 hypothetical protein [Pseudoalteromonas shioyasakiensis]MDI4703452.1 hypothetical protein [Pseudoalteromonas shioyasakiensis]NRA79070.1 hypothetical protein [Pseudoalteromonas sp.]